MKKFFTSLIALCLLFLAVVFANAEISATSENFDKSPNFTFREAAGAQLNLLPPSLFANGKTRVLRDNRTDSSLENRLLSKDRQIKTDTSKTVNAQKAQRLYHPPPNILAYNGAGFANRIRAEPIRV